MVVANTTLGVKAEAAAKNPKGIAIAMRFKFEGKNYGLGVTIFDPTRDRPLGVCEEVPARRINDPRGHYTAPAELVVTLNDTEMNVLIMMLQDLRAAKAETLRLLRGEGPLATKKA